MKAIFKKEFKSYFNNPIGFIILAVYYFFLGSYFSLIYSYGASNVEDVILAMTMVIIFTVPVMTMRLLSEDRRQKIDQALFTAPVKLFSIVLGKFFAAFALYALCFAPTVIFEIIVSMYVGLKLTAYLYALLGVLLLGGALISIGMFISALTESMAVSAVITLIVNIIVIYMGSLASIIDNSTVTKIAEKAAFIDVVQNFSKQLFSIPDIIYFLSIIVGFLFLCERSLEKRRWS